MPTQTPIPNANPAVVPVESPVNSRAPSRRPPPPSASTTSSFPSACRKRCAGSSSNSRPNPNSRAARKSAASSRRINSGAACNISGGTSATRTGTCRSSRSSRTTARSKICRATNSSRIFTRRSACRSIAVLSQDVPRVRFFPSSAQAEEDVAAAKAATEVAGARRAQQSHRQFDRGRSVQSLDRRQSRRVRALRGGRPALRLSPRNGNRRARSEARRSMCMFAPNAARKLQRR